MVKKQKHSESLISSLALTIAFLVILGTSLTLPEKFIGNTGFYTLFYFVLFFATASPLIFKRKEKSIDSLYSVPLAIASFSLFLGTLASFNHLNYSPNPLFYYLPTLLFTSYLIYRTHFRSITWIFCLLSSFAILQFLLDIPDLDSSYGTSIPAIFVYSASGLFILGSWLKTFSKAKEPGIEMRLFSRRMGLFWGFLLTFNTFNDFSNNLTEDAISHFLTDRFTISLSIFSTIIIAAHILYLFKEYKTGKTQEKITVIASALFSIGTTILFWFPKLGEFNNYMINVVFVIALFIQIQYASLQENEEILRKGSRLLTIFIIIKLIDFAVSTELKAGIALLLFSLLLFVQQLYVRRLKEKESK